MNLFLLLLAAFPVYAHTGQIYGFPRAQVYVKDCSDKFVPVYRDPSLTMPLSNPFFSDRYGDWRYFSSDRHGEHIYVRYQGSLVGEMSNCPTEKK